MKSLQILTCTGAEAEPFIADLAALRVKVFREYPYLYEGSETYEQGYLRRYLESPDFVLVLALDAGRVVGASTGQPLLREIEAFQRPFLKNGYALESLFYCGESVLLPEYRGQGVGYRFFDEREAFALRLRPFEYITFCAVDRPAEHPRRPQDYRPHDAFWSKRGYTRHPELCTELGWLEVGEKKETLKPMTFWLKSIRVNRA